VLWTYGKIVDFSNSKSEISGRLGPSLSLREENIGV